MKLNRIILISLVLLAILSLGVVNAQDNSTCNLGVEESFDDLAPDSKVSEDIQIDVDEKFDASSEDVVGEVISDNVTVDVSNIFEGQNATISVTVPEATGTVNITVDEKLYTPEFIGGVATQSISEYSIGLNNVTVKYNDIVKQTSFKVLDGVITNETFSDYFTVVDRYFQLRDFIPEYATLDIRGHVTYRFDINDPSGIRITKPCDLISSTCDGDIGYVIIQSGSGKSNLHDIKIRQLSIIDSNCKLSNVALSSLNGDAYNLLVENSNIGRLSVLSNAIIINCTINEWYSRDNDGCCNVSVFNSTFNGGIYLYAMYWWRNPVIDINIINCNIGGRTDLINANTCLIENCSFNNDIISIDAKNVVLKNNFINATSSSYAVYLSKTGTENYNKVIGNRIYSKNYSGDNAVNAYVDIFPDLGDVIENNTPIQIDLDISLTSNTIFYDENSTIVVNLPGSEGSVDFYFNDEKISTVELIDGVAKQLIDKYCIGINNVTVVYEDLINDIYAINHTSLNVNKVRYCPIDLVYDKNVAVKKTYVEVILPEDANGNITITIFNNVYSITIKQNANGSNNIIAIPALVEGNYTISANFNSIKYVFNETIGSISSIHAPIYNLIVSNVVMDYKDGSKYKVLLTKDGKAVSAGEIVKITFNGKTTNVKTDKNGYATLTLDASPKTYTIKAVYNGVTKSSKATIKNVLKAKNISKKKAKSIKFHATLKTSKNKPIIGKITFKLKGKTYSAKTNKKGIATISLKNLKTGKYSIISKYGACTVKNTITIKK